MKKSSKLTNWLMMGVFACFVILAVGSVEPDPNPNVSSEEEYVSDLGGILKLKENIGDWDAAYVTKHGYFCYKSEAFEAFNSRASESKLSSITYMTADRLDKVSILLRREDNIPTQMVLENGKVYFSYPNDSILELIYDDGKNIEMLGSVSYSMKDLKDKNSYFGKDIFKASLANTAFLLNKNVSRASAGSLAELYGAVFEEVVEEPYYEDGEGDPENLEQGNDGNYVFIEDATQWDDNEIQTSSYELLLWTGKATFKVGGSSCTLSGTIWCPISQYNEVGKYGILCDEKESNLYLGQAEYEGTGFQGADDLSYEVDFRGFKPNTTYYYRAYYKFNTSDHGGIVPKYGNSNEDVFYDTTIKSFTTGDNMLTVDVAMIIDVTGSMSSIINTVKTNALGFYDSFKNCCEEEGIQLLSLNTQVIAFRDLNVDGSRWMETSETYSLPLQTAEFRSFVNGLYASGGGDTPESGMEALQAAFDKTDWGVDDGYHRQVVILWTDAPYLVGTAFTSLTLADVEKKWNAMPSGRRLILFAPNGTGYNSNGGGWENLDGWKNVIHETNLVSGFNNFEYILKSIIGELTSKGKAAKSRADEITSGSYFFLPNE